MSAAAFDPRFDPRPNTRGVDLLLAHCAVVADRAEGHDAAYSRLEAEVGGKLAHLLVFALARRSL